MRYLLIFLFITGFLALKAQKQVVVFYNETTNKSIQVPKGGMVMLQYQGYLNQIELNSNYLLQLNDSSLVIGKPRLIGKPTEIREIRVEDITGFRKISSGSQFLKMALTVGATLGSYYAFSDNDHLTSTQRLYLSVGTGLITNFSIKLIFPTKKVKHKLKDGWRIMLM